MPPVNPITQLVNNIQASVDGLVNDLLGNPVDSNVPQNASGKGVSDFLSQLEQSNWLKLSFPYTFSVEILNSSGDTNPFTDFSLPIAPNTMRQSEEFAISIKPAITADTIIGSMFLKKLFVI